MTQAWGCLRAPALCHADFSIALQISLKHEIWLGWGKVERRQRGKGREGEGIRAEAERGGGRHRGREKVYLWSSVSFLSSACSSGDSRF